MLLLYQLQLVNHGVQVCRRQIVNHNRKTYQELKVAH